ncbi:MAG: CarD family transcriptional regulator [Clostridia bacterium]|nr:CarD family transcriptional regulator [Clostridia bacterium]
MFQVGDRVVYCRTGVCEVQAITPPPFAGMEGHALYYTLKPLYCDAVVYVPVDTEKPIRPVISREEAEALIDSIPGVRVSTPESADIKLWKEQYQSLSGTGACEDLLELVLLIYAKKQRVEERSKTLGQIDQDYMKNAEALLHGELAVALGIGCDEVPGYIRRRMERQ